MEIAVHKQVSFTLELSQGEMELLSEVLNTYDREVLQKLPSYPSGQFADLRHQVQEAVREGRL